MTVPTLLAGAARRTITPPKGIYLIGYGDRSKGNRGVHDDLYASALVFSDGSLQVALVALDILTINEYIVDRVRALCAPVELILCCSHTHSGPIAYADEQSPRRNREYINFLVEAIAGAVGEAARRVEPAFLAYSAGKAEIAINRRQRLPDGRMEIGRNPMGIVDRSLQIVSVYKAGQGNEDGRLATLVNFACHGTVLGPGNLLVSADWIGAMRNAVKREYGGSVLFLQGAAANLNPDMYWEDGRAFDMAAAQGKQVAAGVIAALERGCQRLPALPLRLLRGEAWLPLETPADTPQPPRTYARPLLAMAKLPGWMAFLAEPLLNSRYPWKSRLEARDGFWAVPMRVNALRLGELALVTFAAETFTEIGLQVKTNSPARRTLFASVSDGCISYLHTAEAHPEGGYEVDLAPLAYRYPGRLQAGCEQIATQTALRLLETLFAASG
jgi:hypothetical protein